MQILLLPLGFLTFLVHFAFFMETDDNNRVMCGVTPLTQAPTPP